MMASVEEYPKERGQCETERIASEALMTLHTEGTLSRICDSLKVSDVVQRNARGLWKALQTNPDLSTEEGSNAWFCCCLYIIATDASLPYGLSDPQAVRGQLDGPGFTVTDLLKSADVKITVFFEKMREIRDKHDLSKTVQQQLVKLEKRYCIVCAIFHKFEKLFKEVFREEVHMDVHEDPNVLKALNPEDYDFNRRLCWTLFLLAKGAYLGENQELVLAFDFLVCCVDFVMRYTPAFQLLPPFDSLRLSSSAHSLEETFLRRLCEHCSTSFDRVNDVKKNYTDQFIHSLKNERGLLEIDHLLELYSGVYYHQKDIDEMLFLEHDVHILPTISQTERSPSPKVNSKVPMTPVRSALITVQQFQKILSSGIDGPSDKLKIFFENCSKRPDEAVSDRVSKLQEDFIASLVSVTSEKHRCIAEQRFKMAVRLYFRVMEALLSSEQERLSQKDFSSLLNQDVFHRSLLACAAEVVMTIYSVTWNTSEQAMNSEESDFAFPWILKTFSLKAYDFYKVLESFIRAEASLTKDIIRHLQGVENRILESIAWEQDSPLFDVLASCEVGQLPPPSPTNNNNAPYASAAQLYLSPACGRQTTPVTPPGKVVEGTGLSAPSPLKHNRSPSQGTQPKTPPPPRRSQSLNLFFNKVCRLGHHRLQALCNFLDVPKDLQQKIWTCFEFCITHKPELLKNRHLDQIMMCSIYAMCRVQEKEIKFKTIVNMYKNLPNACQAVYKEAVIGDSVQDTIIVFYNKVFMIALKSYILQFSGNRSNAPPLSPVPKAVTSPLLASPTYTLPGRENFTVSSLRASPFKTPMSPSQMTPRTRALYSFGDLQGSAEKLQLINERMSAVKRVSDQTIIRSNKRLRFDQCDEPSPSSHSGEQTVIVIKRTPGGAVKALTPLSPSKGANADNLQQSSVNTGGMNASEQGDTGEN